MVEVTHPPAFVEIVMSAEIESIRLLEILDSRAQPTLQVELILDEGTRSSAGVPSGASTGSAEVLERRDQDHGRFEGRGVAELAAQAGRRLTAELAGLRLSRPQDQAVLDQRLRDLDGTARLAQLGGNVAVGVSVAACRAIASVRAEPVWKLINDLTSAAGSDHRHPGDVAVPPRLPVPHFNVINGGRRADGPPFQDFMIAPVGAPSLADAIRAGAEIYQRLQRRLLAADLPVGLGDEGGFMPGVADPPMALQLIVEAVVDAGYEPGPTGVAIALDVAATRLRRGTEYAMGADRLSSNGMINYLETLVDRFPIWSIEDGLAEDDWDGWALLQRRLGHRIQIVGDDLFVTNPALIRRGIERRSANACVIKLNQIGTVTQAVDTVTACTAARWGAMVSHRSGETTDPFIADLAVGCGCGQIKAGAPARGERVAKYNRLLEVAASHEVDLWGLPPDRIRPRPAATVGR